MTIPSGYSVPVPHSSPGGDFLHQVLPEELARHRVAVRTLVRLITQSLSVLFFIFMGMQGGAYACGRLVTCTELLVESFSLLDEGEAKERSRKEMRICNFYILTNDNLTVRKKLKMHVRSLIETHDAPVCGAAIPALMQCPFLGETSCFSCFGSFHFFYGSVCTKLSLDNCTLF